MSGAPYWRPQLGGVIGLKLPRVGVIPVTSAVNTGFAQLELADSQNVKKNLEIALQSLLLTGRSGATYLLTVDDSVAPPVLRLAVVPANP